MAGRTAGLEEPGRPAPPPAAPETWRLCLYVVDATPRSALAQANLRRICAERLPASCQVEIVDLQQSPERARADEIVAIPTLVRAASAAGPARRVVGTLADVDRVLAGLGME